MTNQECTERLLKEYRNINYRIRYLERLNKRRTEKGEMMHMDEFPPVDRYEVGGYITRKQKEQDILVNTLIVKTADVEQDLERLRYTKEVLDDALNALKEIDNRGYKVVERHYLHGIRIEDIADLMYMSRSRCYEISKEAVNQLTEFMFGVAIIK